MDPTRIDLHPRQAQSSSANAGDVIQQALQQAFDKESGTTSVGVAVQFILMLVLSLACIAFFSIFRPRNRMVYEPKRKYAAPDRAPPALGKGLFSWVLPILRIKDEDVLDKIGLDAFTFLRFIKMCRNMFLCSAAVSCAILIPVNLAFNLKQSGTNKATGLSLITIEYVGDPYVWAHVVVTYFVTFISLFFIWRYYKEAVRLRWAFFRSNDYQNSLYARTIMVTGLSKRLQTDEGVSSIFTDLQVPYQTSSTHVARTVGHLPELIEKHNRAVSDLEECLAKYLKNPESVPSKRPEHTVGGHLCCGGRKVDAIDYFTQRIADLETEIEDTRERIADKKTINYGFASFQCIPHAHVVAKRLHGKKPKGTVIRQAPHPRDILWRNLALTRAAQRSSRFFGWILFVAVCFAFIVPLIVLAALANLSLLAQTVTGLSNWQNSSPTTFSIVAGVVPPALQNILTFFLPLVMRKISKRQGCKTRSSLDRAVTAKYYFFLVINYLIIFTLFKVIWYLIAQVLIVNISHGESAGSILNQLQQQGVSKTSNALVQNSNYWLTYLALRFFTLFFDLTQLLNLVLIWIKTRMFGRTPRDIVEWTKPPDFEFPLYSSIHLFLATIVFCYIIIAPLVGLVGALLFVLSLYVFRYQFLYVFGSRVETGGTMWRVLVNRTLVGILFMHLAVILCFAIREEWTKLFAFLPPIIVTILFKVYLRRAFDDKLKYFLPGEDEMKSVRMHVHDASRHRLASRFGHPALSEELWTPMVHSKASHLLPQIYKGRLDPTTMHEGKIGVDEEATQLEAYNGLKIEAVDANDLEYDPMRWRQEHGQQDDTRSITTAGWSGANTPYAAPSYGKGTGSATSSPKVRDYFGTRSPPEYTSPYGASNAFQAQTPGEEFERVEDPRKDSRVRLVEDDAVTHDWRGGQRKGAGQSAQRSYEGYTYEDPYPSGHGPYPFPNASEYDLSSAHLRPGLGIQGPPEGQYASAYAYAYPPAQPREYTIPMGSASPPSSSSTPRAGGTRPQPPTADREPWTTDQDHSELDRRARNANRVQGPVFFGMQ